MTQSTPANFAPTPRAVRVGPPTVAKRPADAARAPLTTRVWWDPLVLGLVAFTISAIGSWIPSKWSDEIATQTSASRTLPQLWQMIQNVDAVHGAYYAFMHFWIIAFGTSNFALRAPSMLAVGIACAGVVVLGRRIGGRRLGIFAGLVFAILPRVTWMGMEARSTAMTALVAVWLTILFVHAVERPRARWWILYGVLAAAGVTLNIYLALLVVVHGAMIVLARRHIPRARRMLFRWGIASAAVAIVSMPVVHLATSETGQLPFGPLNLPEVVNAVMIAQYFSGATPTTARQIPVPPTSLWAAAALAVACLGWVLIVAPLVWRRVRPAQRSGAPFGLLVLTVPWIVIPVALVILYSLVSTPIYTPRYFAFTTPAVALLIGASIAALGKRWKQFSVLGLLAVLVVPVYVSQRVPTAKNGADWEQAAAIIQQHASPGQDIYYGPVVPHSIRHMSEIRDGYPAVLSTLHDITLRQTGAQDATLWGTHWNLSHAATQLQSTPVLWAVLEHYGTPSPRTTVAERYIEAQGLHLVHIWRGSATDVLEFAR